MDNISSLIDEGKINIRRKTSKSPKKSPLSKDYQKFLKRSKEKKEVEVDKKEIVKKLEVNKKDNDLRNKLKKILIKKEPDNLQVLRIKNNDKKMIKVLNSKDNNKSKNKFTKKSQEKKNKRNSKRKKIHRKISKVKKLSFLD